MPTRCRGLLLAVDLFAAPRAAPAKSPMRVLHLQVGPFAQAPPGTVAEGGNVTVFDSDGKRLATVGAQFK